MASNPEQIIARRSPLQFFFRVAILVLSVGIIWLGMLLNSYWSTDAEIEHVFNDPERVEKLIAARDTVVSIIGVIGAIVLVAVVVGALFLYNRTRRYPLIIGRDAVSLPDGSSVSFTDIEHIVQYNPASQSDIHIVEGAVVQLEDAPNTGIDSIYLLPKGVEPNSCVCDRYLLPKQASAIPKFFQYPQNEALVIELVKRYRAVKPDGKVWTIVNKYKKQRVLTH